MPAPTEPPLVALQLPPGPRFSQALTSLWQGGAAVLPLAPDLPVAALQRLLADFRPARLVRPDGSEEPLRAPLPVEEDTALVVLTSGSAGRPKAVELTHEALAVSARASLDRLGAAADDRWLLCLPVHHVAGILVLVRSALLQTAPAIHASFDPAAIAREPDVTQVSLVPTMLARLLDAGVDVARFRCLLLGGAPVPAGLLTRARRAGARVVCSYGMTETAGGCVYDGVPLDGVEVRVDVDRRIAVRGAVLMRRYRGRPALTATVLRDGWLVTADVGRWTVDGRLEVLGRADDVIVTGGVNVDPSEVAALLVQHPLVAEAAVVGRADERWGQRVVAVCVPADPAHPPDVVELRRFVAERAEAVKAPQELVVVDALPRGGLGKVDRRRLDARPAAFGLSRPAACGLSSPAPDSAAHPTSD